MYNKSDKRRLYWLIEQYLAGEITERFFCDEFYYSYGLEIDSEMLNENEKVVFSDLNKVTSRFSPYEEDHKLDEKAFTSLEELKFAILQTSKRLKM